MGKQTRTTLKNYFSTGKVPRLEADDLMGIFATDPSIPNPMYTDPDNTAGYLGMSLSHYGVRWKAPTSTENVMELTADQIYEAIYEQLCE